MGASRLQGFAVGCILSDFAPDQPGVTMRIAIIVVAGAALTLSAAAPARACYEEGFSRPLAEGVVAAAASTELSARKHHKAKHKVLRKHKKKKEKVEYMRAVPAK